MNTTPNPLWLAEFRGFFWGEGNFMIDLAERQVGKCLTWTARVRVRVIQRDDEAEVLENIRSVLGGHLYGHKSYKMVSGGNGRQYVNNRQITWQLQDKDTIEKVLDFLDGGLLPHSKRLQIAVMRDAIAVMRSRRYSYTDEQKQQLRELKARLEGLRKYAGVKVPSE